MKKLLLATSLLGALSTSAIAVDHGMYGRLDINGGWLVNNIGADNMKGGQLVKKDASNKPMAWWGQIGVGSYLMDSVRVEVNGFYLMDTDFDKLVSLKEEDLAANLKDLNNGTESDLKVDIESAITVGSKGALAKAYFDVADLGGAKLFVGGAVGYSWTTVSQKLSGNKTVAVNNSPAEAGTPITVKSENYGDFAYGFNAGVSYEISESAEVQVEYSFLHLADVKDNGATSPVTYGEPYHINAHNVGVGVRFYF